jgi:hypothetical protein
MSTAYPAALDSPVSIDGATDHLDDVPHDALHEDTLAGLIAAQTKLGTGASTPDSNKVLLGTGAGASAWSDAAAARTALGLVIGTNVQAFADVPSYNGIQFPAVQVANAGANVLDDYEEGTWTPAVTFATPGDVAVAAYAAQQGRYTKVGRAVHWQVNVQITAGNLTWTTASGALRISGLPFTPGGANGIAMSGGICRGWTKANFTHIGVNPVAGQSYIEVWAHGSGQTPTQLVAAEFTTGAVFWLFSQGSYSV